MHSSGDRSRSGGDGVCDVAHLTTVHSREDIRVRRKEAATLAAAFGSPVCLFVRDGKGAETDVRSQVYIFDIGGVSLGRMGRMTGGVVRMWRAVAAARPKVAHFHDPELIPLGLVLKLNGVRVVYDVHEDVPRQILDKHWLNPWLRRPVAVAVEGAEWICERVLDGIVAATPAIAKRFSRGTTVVVQNFPLVETVRPLASVPYARRAPHFAYVGGITRGRGAMEMIGAVAAGSDQVRLRLAGRFQPPGLKEDAERSAGWSKVDYEGWVDHERVANILGSVRAGLVLFHPERNHMESQPNKLFEYMAAGLPVIASDFPHWRAIVDGSGCGLLVDPMDMGSIADAMSWVLDHPVEAAAMGRRGRRAIEERYNWASESEKLVALYRKLLAK